MPALPHQLLVRTMLDNAALFQDHDLIGVCDRAQPMCDDKTSAIL